MLRWFFFVFVRIWTSFSYVHAMLRVAVIFYCCQNWIISSISHKRRCYLLQEPCQILFWDVCEEAFGVMNLNRKGILQAIIELKSSRKRYKAVSCASLLLILSWFKYQLRWCARDRPIFTRGFQFNDSLQDSLPIKVYRTKRFFTKKSKKYLTRLMEQLILVVLLTIIHLILELTFWPMMSVIWTLNSPVKYFFEMSESVTRSLRALKKNPRGLRLQFLLSPQIDVG